MMLEEKLFSLQEGNAASPSMSRYIGSARSNTTLPPSIQTPCNSNPVVPRPQNKIVAEEDLNNHLNILGLQQDSILQRSSKTTNTKRIQSQKQYSLTRVERTAPSSLSVGRISAYKKPLEKERMPMPDILAQGDTMLMHYENSIGNRITRLDMAGFVQKSNGACLTPPEYSQKLNKHDISSKGSLASLWDTESNFSDEEHPLNDVDDSSSVEI